MQLRNEININKCGFELSFNFEIISLDFANFFFRNIQTRLIHRPTANFTHRYFFSQFDGFILKIVHFWRQVGPPLLVKPPCATWSYAEERVFILREIFVHVAHARTCGSVRVCRQENDKNRMMSQTNQQEVSMNNQYSDVWNVHLTFPCQCLWNYLIDS